MVVCFQGARIRRDLFKSLEVFWGFFVCFFLSSVSGKVLNRVHLNPVSEGSNVPTQAQKMKEITFKRCEIHSVGRVNR